MLDTGRVSIFLKVSISSIRVEFTFLIAVRFFLFLFFRLYILGGRDFVKILFAKY